MSKRCLVTGSAGFIGRNLVDYLLQHTDWELVCLDRLDHAGNLNRLGSIPKFAEHFGERVTVHHHDLRSAISPLRAQQLGRFDYILHLAAGSHVDRSILDPELFIADNVIGTHHALNFARTNLTHADSGRFLYFSTDEVFGPAPPGVTHLPWSPHNPQNPYAAAKSGGEQLCPSYATCYGLPIIVTHCTNVIGPLQDEEKFLPTLIRNTVERKVTHIHTVDGQVCSRYYTHVDNVCSAVLFLLEKGTTLDGSLQSGRYNISGEREVNNLELAHMVAQMLDCDPLVQEVDRPPGRIKPDLRYCVDDSALVALGWKRPVTFFDGLVRTVTGGRLKVA